LHFHKEPRSGHIKINEKIGMNITADFFFVLYVKASDGGHPETCNVFSYYRVFASQKEAEVCAWCTKAEKGCTDCKKILAEEILKRLKPIQDKRQELLKDKGQVEDILKQGAVKARAIAQETMSEVRTKVFS